MSIQSKELALQIIHRQNARPTILHRDKNPFSLLNLAELLMPH
jgi:hypothetical protein